MGGAAREVRILGITPIDQKIEDEKWVVSFLLAAHFFISMFYILES